MVGVDEENDIAFSDLLAQGGSVLRTGRGIDDGCRDIFWGSDAGRNSDLGEDWLDLVAHELVLDERSNEAGLARALVATHANSNCVEVEVST